MQELLSYIIANVVGDSDKVEISKEETPEGEITFNVMVPEEERGVIIGKAGKNIKAIRNILAIIAKRENKHVYIKILD
jgi:predicted RNA-binding protein YlqC (UPF0109 family)